MEIHINVDRNMPVRNTDEHVSVNVKGARVLRNLCGLKSPGKSYFKHFNYL